MTENFSQSINYERVQSIRYAKLTLFDKVFKI